MKTRKELKEQAKTALRGNWPWAIGVFLLPILVLGVIFFALSAVINMIWNIVTSDPSTSSGVVAIFIIMTFLMVALFTFLATIGIGVGVSYAYLDLIRGRKRSFREAATYAFKGQHFDSIFGVWLVNLFYVCLWSLLLIIPGWVKAYSYSQSFFILKDDMDQDKGITTTSAITKSRLLMEGHKKELFLLNLSFIGWYFLAGLIGGLGCLILIPYHATTLAAFYENLLEQERPKELDVLEEKLAEIKVESDQAMAEYQLQEAEKKAEKAKAHSDKITKKLAAQKDREEKRLEKVAEKRERREEKAAKKGKPAKKSTKKVESSEKEEPAVSKKETQDKVTDGISSDEKDASPKDREEKVSSKAQPKANQSSSKKPKSKSKKSSKKKSKKRK
ncbi:DUF975 family protein [Streptococcus dentapri]|uniref:DUF975 family protein n=1 Tax=Streptococcus dentapri TaxID=573564 RepID=A0ABV8D1C5_9STRE